MQLYKDRDERSYGSVYCTDVKKELLELLRDFDRSIKGYNGTISEKRDLRKSLEADRDWNYSYTYNRSSIDVNVYLYNSEISYTSLLDEYVGYGNTISSYANSKSYHIYSKKSIFAWTNPYYIKRLKLKIGMVGY